MGNFLKGIEYPIFAGLGALLGLFVGAPVMALLSLAIPGLWAWSLVPCAIGALIGLVIAATIQ